VTSAVLSSCCKLAYTSVLRQFGGIWSLWLVKGLKTNILLVNWREQKNIFKSFPDKYYTACSVHQHSRYIDNCFHCLLEYYNKPTNSCVRSIEHWIHLTIFISIWSATMFPQFFRMYYISLLIRWRKQLSKVRSFWYFKVIYWVQYCTIYITECSVQYKTEQCVTNLCKKVPRKKVSASHKPGKKTLEKILGKNVTVNKVLCFIFLVLFSQVSGNKKICPWKRKT